MSIEPRTRGNAKQNQENVIEPPALDAHPCTNLTAMGGDGHWPRRDGSWSSRQLAGGWNTSEAQKTGSDTENEASGRERERGKGKRRPDSRHEKGKLFLSLPTILFPVVRRQDEGKHWRRWSLEDRPRIHSSPPALSPNPGQFRKPRLVTPTPGVEFRTFQTFGRHAAQGSAAVQGKKNQLDSLPPDDDDGSDGTPAVRPSVRPLPHPPPICAFRLGIIVIVAR